MANKEPLPLSTPPPASPPTTTGTPLSLNNPAIVEPASPAAQQKKRLIMIGGGSLLFLAIIGTVPFLFLSTSPKKTKTTPTITPTPTQKEQVEATATKEITSRVFIKATSGRTSYDLSVSPPIGWNASFSTTPAAPAYPWAGSLLVSAVRSGYSPLSTANVNTPSTNFIALMDATDWLSSTQNPTPMTAAEKQAWFAAVNTLSESAITPATTIKNPTTTTESGRQSIKYTQAKDGSMHGFSYLTQPSAGRYEPSMITVMVGKLGERSVILYGQHALRDKQWSDLANLQSTSDSSYAARRDAAIAGFASGKLNDDTIAIFDEFMKSVQSFKITPAS